MANENQQMSTSSSGDKRRLCSVIDNISKEKITVLIENKDGEAIDILETFKNIREFIEENLVDSDSNPFRDGIFIVAQTITQYVLPMVAPGLQGLPMYSTIERISDVITSVGFLLNKYINDNNLTLRIERIPIEDSDIDEIMRLNDISKELMLAQTLGVPLMESLNKLKELNEVTDEEFKKIKEQIERSKE